MAPVMRVRGDDPRRKRRAWHVVNDRWDSPGGNAPTPARRDQGCEERSPWTLLTVRAARRPGQPGRGAHRISRGESENRRDLGMRRKTARAASRPPKRDVSGWWHGRIALRGRNTSKGQGTLREATRLTCLPEEADQADDRNKLPGRRSWPGAIAQSEGFAPRR